MLERPLQEALENGWRNFPSCFAGAESRSAIRHGDPRTVRMGQRYAGAEHGAAQFR